MNRRGFSLTELLVVMGMASVILTAGTGMLHRVMHEQRLAARENITHRVAERLSTRLRGDVHFADRAALTGRGGEQRLALKQPDDRTVTYFVQNNVLERTSTREGEAAHRDQFRFPGNCRLEFGGDTANCVSFTAFAVPQAAALRGDRSQSGGNERDVRRAVLCIEASVGRDHRFIRKTTEAD